ncbi:MAG: hypothetical protein LBC19_06530 [Tannerella sp.]|jgi:hypothetical protein|nr:hypothetical protein [Tannerella sp.]
MKKGKTDIKALVEAYFNGLTGLKEEQLLRDYFRKDDLPEALKAYQPIFRYMIAEREDMRRRKSPPSRRRNIRKWSVAAAAAVLLLCLALPFSIRRIRRPTTSTETSRVYIDGEKHTNTGLIRSETLKSLEHLAESNKSVFSSQSEALESFF